jgi:hypothetical protein
MLIMVSAVPWDLCLLVAGYESVCVSVRESVCVCEREVSLTIKI